MFQSDHLASYVSEVEEVSTILLIGMAMTDKCICKCIFKYTRGSNSKLNRETKFFFIVVKTLINFVHLFIYFTN